jgi:hypothetical protein
MAAEIQKYVVGPMPAEEFLNEFFPVNELPASLSRLPQFKPGKYDRTINAKSEKKAYDPFVSLNY